MQGLKSRRKTSIIKFKYGCLYFQSSPSNSTYLPSNHSNRTTSSYVQNWADQIEEIQSRRLPEPPPILSTAKDSKSPILKDNPCIDRLDSVDEFGGYLKPTFQEKEESENEKDNSSEFVTKIPVTSYEVHI